MNIPTSIPPRISQAPILPIAAPSVYDGEPSFKQIVYSGSSNCGQISFSDFRVWYSESEKKIAFNVTGKSADVLDNAMSK